MHFFMIGPGFLFVSIAETIELMVVFSCENHLGPQIIESIKIALCRSCVFWLFQVLLILLFLIQRRASNRPYLMYVCIYKYIYTVHASTYVGPCLRPTVSTIQICATAAE